MDVNTVTFGGDGLRSHVHVRMVHSSTQYAPGDPELWGEHAE